MNPKWKPSPPPYRKFKQENLQKYLKVSQFIYQLGEDKILTQSTKQVPPGKIQSFEYQAKFKYLKDCLIKYRQLTGVGRGIAAVQVGIPERFSVVYLGAKKITPRINPDHLLIIINPIIKNTATQKFLYPEMCMSAVPVIAPVVRPAWIEFEYLDENGKQELWNTHADTDFGQMMNRVFQHEIDHMDGIINLFKVATPKDLLMESNPDFYKNAQFTEVI